MCAGDRFGEVIGHDPNEDEPTAPRMMVRRADLEAIRYQFGMNRAQRRAQAKKAKRTSA